MLARPLPDGQGLPLGKQNQSSAMRTELPDENTDPVNQGW
jgi:hypothetical protein